MQDIVALGEVFVDFVPLGNRSFQANPGGAPANVAAAAARLGVSAAFMGMVGDDDFGQMLVADLASAGVDTVSMRCTPGASTTMVFQQPGANGAPPSFTYVRRPGADMFFTPEDVDYGKIAAAKAFHFGSLSLTAEPVRSAAFAAAEYARGQGKLVSFAPGLQLALWHSPEEARQMVHHGMSLSDIVKVSEQELEFLTGTSEVQAGADKLHELGVMLAFVTMGPKGCFYSSPTACGHMDTYDLPTVDTTGAGDAFMAGILARALERDKRAEDMGNKDDLAFMADFANAAGALATTRRGGIPAMPTRQQVLHILRAAPKAEPAEDMAI